MLQHYGGGCNYWEVAKWIDFTLLTRMPLGHALSKFKPADWFLLALGSCFGFTQGQFWAIMQANGY
jgi:hypothetical protein